MSRNRVLKYNPQKISGKKISENTSHLFSLYHICISYSLQIFIEPVLNAITVIYKFSTFRIIIFTFLARSLI